MYLYNTTFVIDKSELSWWQDWMKCIYLPTFADVVPSAINDLYKLEDSVQAPNSTTYSCQWHCDSLQILGEIDKYSKALHNELMKAKGDKCLFFSTMMKKVVL